MQFEFNAHYPRELVAQSINVYWWHFIGRRAVVVVILEIAGVLALHFFNPSGSWVVELLPWVIGTIALAIILYVQLRIRTLKRFDRMNQKSTNFKLSDDRFEMAGEQGSSSLKWSIFNRVLRCRDFWLLFYEKHSFVTLPTDGLDQATLNFISDHIFEGTKRV